MSKFNDGVWPVMLTPFTDDNEVDYEALGKLVDWYIENGVAGLFADCQSSEMFYLSLEERIKIARNEFSFNPRSYWHSRGIIHRVKFKKLKVLGYAKPNNFISLIKWTVNSYHYGLTNWFEQLPSGLRDYGETLLLGYTRPDFYSDNDGIQLLGLMHLFSISGFQVAGIYQIWRCIARRCGIQREHSLIIVQVLMGALWLFAGGVQSLVRPILLGIFQAWRELNWLTIDTKDAWGLSLIGGLLIEPGVLHNLGGQLSYLLTFGLLWLSNRPGWYQSIWLSFFILPTLLWHTFSWHPISLVANLCIVPLFTWLVIPTILIGITASCMQLTLVRDVCETLINGIQYCIGFGEKIPGGIIIWQTTIDNVHTYDSINIRLVDL